MNCSLKVIGTGSKENCYLLTVGDEVLVIEAGINFTAIKKALNFDLSKVVGILVTHEHGDHSCAVKDFQKFGKDIYCTVGTGEALKLKNYKPDLFSHWNNLGNFYFCGFKTYHDAAQPCGFLIEFNGKRLVFLTDSSDLRTKFDNVDYWIIEANYSNNKLKTSGLNSSLKKRIQDTHMSIDRCKTILDYHNSKFAVLIHASENHADKEEFIKKIPYAIVAENGMEIELN
jgi:phosphoribosyl 1,2-cyclic phosphodiesterase